MIGITIDGFRQEANLNERIVDFINRTASRLAQVCYHPQLGPIQICDTCGVLEVARGTLGGGRELVEQAVSGAGLPEVLQATRNVLLLTKLLGEIDPTVLSDMTRAFPTALSQANTEKANPPGPFNLIGSLWNKDFRRGLAAFRDFLVMFGKTWRKRIGNYANS